MSINSISSKPSEYRNGDLGGSVSIKRLKKQTIGNRHIRRNFPVLNQTDQVDGYTSNDSITKHRILGQSIDDKYIKITQRVNQQKDAKKLAKILSSPLSQKPGQIINFHSPRPSYNLGTNFPSNQIRTNEQKF